MSGKTWLITGCSSGFGKVMAEELLSRGENVIATARKPETLDALTGAWPETAIGLKLDVTRQADIEAAVNAGLERFGNIDVLVNNAGYGQMGAVENAPMQMARDAMETNYFGPLALIKAVLPGMIARRSGQIVNVGSIAGQVGFPLIADYCASKFAVSGMSESLGAELEPLGIFVTLAELGPFETGFAGAMAIVPPPEHYDPVALSQEAGNGGWTSVSPAIDGVRALLKALGAPRPPRRLLLGEQGLEVAELHDRRRQAEREKWIDVIRMETTA